MRIAVLGGDGQLSLICSTVIAMGHKCHSFKDGKTFLHTLRNESFDLLILDWDLPDMPSSSVVMWIRQSVVSALPVLLLINDFKKNDMIDGLNAGADNFISKPIFPNEIKAHVNALLRRAYSNQHTSEIVFGPYRFLPRRRSVEVNGLVVELGSTEYQLSIFLFQNLGRLYSRDYLQKVIWGSVLKKSSRSLDIYISKLRTKLNLRPHNGYSISSIRGIGYRLEIVDVTSSISLCNLIVNGQSPSYTTAPVSQVRLG